MSTDICRLGEGHSLCPRECWLSVGKSPPPLPKTTKMLSTRNSSILMMSSWVCLLFESESYLTKKGSSRPKTKYLYLRCPFLWICVSPISIFVNQGNIYCVDEGYPVKKWRKTASYTKRMMQFFSISLGWWPPLTLKNISLIPYFILTLLIVHIDFNLSVAHDVAIDVAQCAFLSKVMRKCPQNF